MAAELEKLAQELKAKGYEIGGGLVLDLAKSLYRHKLIPQTVFDSTLPSPLGPEIDTLDVRGTEDFCS